LLTPHIRWLAADVVFGPLTDELREQAQPFTKLARRTWVAHRRRLRGARHAAGGQPSGRPNRKGFKTSAR